MKRRIEHGFGHLFLWVGLLSFALVSASTTFEGARVLLVYPFHVPFTVALQGGMLGLALLAKSTRHPFRVIPAYAFLAAISTVFSFVGVAETFDRATRPIRQSVDVVRGFEESKRQLSEAALEIKAAAFEHLENRIQRLVAQRPNVGGERLRLTTSEIQATRNKLRAVWSFDPAVIGSIPLASTNPEDVNVAVERLAEQRRHVEDLWRWLPEERRNRYALPLPPSQIVGDTLTMNSGSQMTEHPFVIAVRRMFLVIRRPTDNANDFLALLVALPLDLAPLLIALWMREPDPKHEQDKERSEVQEKDYETARGMTGILRHKLRMIPERWWRPAKAYDANTERLKECARRLRSAVGSLSQMAISPSFRKNIERHLEEFAVRLEVKAERHANWLALETTNARSVIRSVLIHAKPSEQAITEKWMDDTFKEVLAAGGIPEESQSYDRHRSAGLPNEDYQTAV